MQPFTGHLHACTRTKVQERREEKRREENRRQPKTSIEGEPQNDYCLHSWLFTLCCCSCCWHTQERLLPLSLSLTHSHKEGATSAQGFKRGRVSGTLRPASAGRSHRDSLSSQLHPRSRERERREATTKTDREKKKRRSHSRGEVESEKEVGCPGSVARISFR